MDLARTLGWLDSRALDAFGRRLGRVSAVLADGEGNPWWLLVRRRGRTLVAPVTSVADEERRGLVLGCTREQLESAPAGDMTPALHAALLRHFGVGTGTPAPPRLRGDCVPRRWSRLRIR